MKASQSPGRHGYQGTAWEGRDAFVDGVAMQGNAHVQ